MLVQKLLHGQNQIVLFALVVDQSKNAPQFVGPKSGHSADQPNLLLQHNDQDTYG